MITSSGRRRACAAIVNAPSAPSGIVAITNTAMTRAWAPCISANAITIPITPSTTPIVSCATHRAPAIRALSCGRRAISRTAI